MNMHHVSVLQMRGFTFALAHVKSDMISEHLDESQRIALPAGAVMMPMWVVDTPSTPFVLAILGSEPNPYSEGRRIAREAFLSLVKAPPFPVS